MFTNMCKKCVRWYDGFKYDISWHHVPPKYVGHMDTSFNVYLQMLNHQKYRHRISITIYSITVKKCALREYL